MKKVKSYNFETLSKLPEVFIEHVPLMFVDTISLNRSFYPEEDVIKAIEQYNKVADNIDPTYRYMLIRHPRILDRSDDSVVLEEADISYEKVAGWLQNIYYDKESKVVYGDIKILNTPKGLIVRYLYENGYPLGFSARISHKEIEEKYDKEKNILYFVKKGLRIKGFDFVINPAFALTWVRKEDIDDENISVESVVHEISEEILNTYNIHDETVKHDIESTIKEICPECICEIGQSCNIYGASVEAEIINHNKNSQKSEIEKKLNEDGKILHGGIDMPEKNEQFELERLRLERDKLLTEKEKLELELLKLSEKRNNLEAKIEELSKKNEELSKEVIDKEAEFKVLNRKLAEYEEQINKLEETLKSLEEELNKKREELVSVEQAMEKNKKKAKSVSVELFGKVYDEENRPKIRIVPVSEKVSTKAWGDVPKLPIRKAVWLSNDKKVIREAFGVLDEGWENDYAQLKYPHHELQPSEVEGYDLDLVLNVNGLRTAMLFALGRAGMYLTPEQKRKLGRHLARHYRELMKAELVEDIPEGVKRLQSAENVVIEAENDEVLTNIIDVVLTKGYLQVDIPEEDNEGVESIVVDVDENGEPIEKIDIKKIVIPEEKAGEIYSDISYSVFKYLFGGEEPESMESVFSKFEEILIEEEEKEDKEQTGMNDDLPPEGMGMGEGQEPKGNENNEPETQGVETEESYLEKIHNAIGKFIAQFEFNPLEQYDVDGQDINKTKAFLISVADLIKEDIENGLTLMFKLKAVYDAITVAEENPDVGVGELPNLLAEYDLAFAEVFIKALREVRGEVENEQPNVNEGQGVAQDINNNNDNIDINSNLENKSDEEVEEMAKLQKVIDKLNSLFEFNDNETVNEENIESKIEALHDYTVKLVRDRISVEMELVIERGKTKLITEGLKDKVEEFTEKAQAIKNDLLTKMEEEGYGDEIISEFVDKINELVEELSKKEGQEGNDEKEGVEAKVNIPDGKEDDIMTDLERKGSVKSDVKKKENKSLLDELLFE